MEITNVGDGITSVLQEIPRSVYVVVPANEMHPENGNVAIYIEDQLHQTIKCDKETYFNALYVHRRHRESIHLLSQNLYDTSLYRLFPIYFTMCEILDCYMDMIIKIKNNPNDFPFSRCSANEDPSEKNIPTIPTWKIVGHNLGKCYLSVMLICYDNDTGLFFTRVVNILPS
jgi:hypothetical protein